MPPTMVEPVHRVAAHYSSSTDAANRNERRRSAVAIAIAIALHLVALYYLTAHTVPIELTNMPGGGTPSISVSLVAAPPVPAVARPVAPEVPKPVAPPVPRPVKSKPVLATHRESPRVVTQQDKPDPQPEPHEAQPAAQQAQATPPAAVSTATPTAAAASDNSKMMALPKAIDSAALHQLQCRIPAPSYPPRAKRLGEAGTVQVRVTIGTDGRFSDARVVASSSYEDLDNAAIQAISSGTCQPYRQNGTAMAVTAVQPVSFNLDD
ncbi:energy transducer TonB [Paraburkholderia sp. BCC1885]|uniref:energy transducer TonB n=1 Tax=Paraburkholderia sp. BCC1885 TaxID=2562669 RepID=UPI001182092E|nr:energy transducer TonB [Paraburkholderia sp. BCC1885]